MGPKKLTVLANKISAKENHLSDDIYSIGLLTIKLIQGINTESNLTDFQEECWRYIEPELVHLLQLMVSKDKQARPSAS